MYELNAVEVIMDGFSTLERTVSSSEVSQLSDVVVNGESTGTMPKAVMYPLIDEGIEFDACVLINGETRSREPGRGIPDKFQRKDNRIEVCRKCDWHGFLDFYERSNFSWENKSAPDEVMCPMIDEIIDSYICVGIRDIPAGLFKLECMPDRFKKKDNWIEICKACEWHDF